MKQYFTFLIASAVLLFMVSCKTVEPEVVRNTLSVSATELVFPVDGGMQSVDVSSNTEWKASCDAGWLTFSPSKGKADRTITISVASHKGDAREAVLTISAEDLEPKTVKILQDGYVYKAVFEGNGTESSPYVIDSADALVRMSTELSNSYEHYASAWFSVPGNINMSGKTYNPACQDPAKPFKGHFICNGTISNLKINNTAQKASGLFAYTDAAVISGVKLADADINSDYVFSGAITGYAKNGTVVENCTITGQVRAYKDGITVSATGNIPVESANAGYAGSFVGFAEESTIKGCTLSGKASFYGKFCGGVVGYAYNSTIEDCHVGVEVPVNIYYHYSGGIAGRVNGSKSLVSKCSFEGLFSCCGYASGGIVGQLLGGTVRDCVMGSHANYGVDKYYVGGIVGAAQPFSDIVIDRCACYGAEIRGSYGIGGIVGYTGGGTGTDKDLLFTSNTSGKNVTIKDCASIGAHLIATGGNSYGYAIVGGILGWSNSNSSLQLSGCYSLPGIYETTYGKNLNGVFSGICSYQNTASGATIENCYTALTPNDFYICNDKVVGRDALWYAGIHIRCTGATAVKNCFTEESMRCGYSSASATESGCATLTTAQLTDGTLLSKLNATSSGTKWVAGTNGFPTIEGLPADPNPKASKAKKVSVIGDSISTFRGWVPAGYSCHYPATDGTLTLVNETYWYRLVHDYMKSAEIEMNIAFSGSTVTNTTQANYTAKYGSATNAWFQNSFTERFAACGGCGRPDIILIHGGTNDWAHNADPLAPGVAIRNDASNIYGGNAPSEAIMKSIFATADAAKTRTAVNALPDGTYCEAYAKLLCQIRERYPQCKVVCIIGDYLGQSVEQSTIQIAEHYGAKVVNLFRVNGFNDLGGYTEATFKNQGTQPNMPKHDYSGAISGCHPGSKAMEFIANKIYTELGTWLEQ